jgi:hypothetical protein
MYEEIAERSDTLDAIEYALGTSFAEQAAYLYEDLLDDPDRFNVNALDELQSFLDDYLQERPDPDAEYIRNQAHTMLHNLSTGA